MSIENLVQQMLILLIYLAAGCIASRTGIIDAHGNKKLSALFLNVTQPAMILAAAINSDFNFGPVDILKFLAYASLMYACLTALSFATSPLYKTEEKKKKVLRFATIFGNVAFMGYPVVASIYGDSAVLIASLYCIPCNVLSYSAGILMISGDKNAKINFKLMINPPLIATVLALLVVFFRPNLPYVITQSLTQLGSMTVPGAMLVIGASLGAASFKSIFTDKHAYLLCFFKLIVSPVMIWLLCGLVVKDPMYFGILVVLAGMPVGAITTMFSLEYGGDSETASRCVFLTTILAVLTSPLMNTLLLS